MKLLARDPMSQLAARLTFGLAKLPEDLVCWVCVALAHGALHFCEHLCEVMMIISKCRLVSCLTQACTRLECQLNCTLNQKIFHLRSRACSWLQTLCLSERINSKLYYST